MVHLLSGQVTVMLKILEEWSLRLIEQIDRRESIC